MAEHKGFFLYLDQFKPISRLTREQKGELLEAMFAHNAGEPFEFSDPLVEMAFGFFEQTFERDKQRYEDKCAKMRDNAAKKQMVADGSKSKQLVAKETKSTQQQKQEQKQEQDKKKEEGEDAGKPAAPSSSVPAELLEFTREFQNEVAITHGNTAPKITDSLIEDGALELERAVRIDGLELEEAKRALMWAVHDDFWGQNLKSMARMRSKTKAGITKLQSAIGEYRRYAGKFNDQRDRWAGAI